MTPGLAALRSARQLPYKPDAFSNLISGCGSVRIPRACGRIAWPQSGSGSALAFCQTRKPSRHWAAVLP